MILVPLTIMLVYRDPRSPGVPQYKAMEVLRLEWVQSFGVRKKRQKSESCGKYTYPYYPESAGQQPIHGADQSTYSKVELTKYPGTST